MNNVYLGVGKILIIINTRKIQHFSKESLN